VIPCLSSLSKNSLSVMTSLGHGNPLIYMQSRPSKASDIISCEIPVFTLFDMSCRELVDGPTRTRRRGMMRMSSSSSSTSSTRRDCDRFNLKRSSISEVRGCDQRLHRGNDDRVQSPECCGSMEMACHGSEWISVN
jgi:hypothetical protein